MLSDLLICIKMGDQCDQIDRLCEGNEYKTVKCNAFSAARGGFNVSARCLPLDASVVLAGSWFWIAALVAIAPFFLTFLIKMVGA